MAILSNDVKLIASRVMDDFPEGGGAPTATVIQDGASNAIFQDISELDRAGGDVSFRKVFIHVQTDDTATYLGSNVIVAEPPTDPNVSVTLFSTGATFDERTSASGRVESYLVAGPEAIGYLFENHITGQRAVQLFQRPDTAPPTVGSTILLVYKEGVAGERLQYIRVIDTSVVRRTFSTDVGSVFDADVVTCELSDPLRFDFPGSPPSSIFRKLETATKVRESSVGDAAVYAGVAATSASVEIGDLKVKVESIFTQLVPSAQTETPLVDQNAAGTNFAVTEAADGTVSVTTNQPINSATSLSLGNPIVPGTLSITTPGGLLLTDVGGQVFDGATAVGVIEYGRGQITFPALASSYSGTKTLTYKIAGAPIRVGDTAQILVTPESRSFNYVLTILPTPAAGSLLASYRAQGRWYDLRDNGGGVLRGTDSTYGVGSVNYATGAVSVTLGALPDDASSVLFLWSSKISYNNRSSTVVAPPSVRMQLADGDIQPNSVTITWNDGEDRTASDNGRGSITGSATGSINYETGELKLAPTNLPLNGQSYDVEYSIGDVDTGVSYAFPIPVRNLDGTVDMVFDLGGDIPVAGTLSLQWTLEMIESYVPNGAGSGYTVWAPTASTRVVRDDGLGALIDVAGVNVGTINYATGAAHITLDGNYVARGTTYRYVSGVAGYAPPLLSV